MVVGLPKIQIRALALCHLTRVSLDLKLRKIITEVQCGESFFVPVEVTQVFTGVYQSYGGRR